MEDPVLMPDGQTYERHAIEAALEVSPFSPITRQPMKIEDAVPNYALKSLIQAYQAKHTPIAGQNLSSQDIHIDYFGATTQPDPTNPSNDLIHIRITPHEVPSRRPLALIAMIDISGSMSNYCTEIKDLEDIPLTRLQLVKHALKTIIATLSDTDIITLITFHTTAQVLLPSTKLDSEGKVRVTQAIDSMKDRCATNIWDALKLGIDCASGLQSQDYNISLLLFTDGEPNRNPPMGIIPTLSEYISGKPMNYTISTFGFGYQLDSELLEGIARIGNGIYGYCPDSTMVGTIFINYMSNVLCLLTPSTFIIKGPSIDLKIHCDLYNGSSRNFLYSLPKDSISETRYAIQYPNSDQLIQGQPAIPCSNEKEIEMLRNQYWRKKLLDILLNALTNLMATAAESLKQVEALFLELTQEKEPTTWMKKLMLDLVSESPNYGQVSKAFSKEYYPKWGKDYLRSFMRFHIVEQCGNFKDESLQLYGGPPFMNFRQIANRLFCEIPPPEPEPIQKPPEDNNPPYQVYNPANVKTPKKHAQFTADNVESAPSESLKPRKSFTKTHYSHMSRVNSRYTGCFGGFSYVHMFDNTFKFVKDLLKGDRLINGSYVDCVIRINQNQMSQAVTLNGAIFTPWHPIKIDGNWVFPADIAKIEEIYVDAWYNLVLSDKNNRVVEINGIEAVTLGHGLKGRVVEHPYFGSEIPINALKLINGYQNGYVEVENREPIRDQSGLIVQYF